MDHQADDQPSLCPFKKLLNKLSSHIDGMYLKSLMHVCGDGLITAAEREKITHAFEVFRILEQKEKIGKEPKKIAFLLDILKASRPKNKKLVEMVKRYIKDNYAEQDRQEILDVDELESSSDYYRPDISQPFLPKRDTDWAMDCGCNCICHGECCCFCCVVVAIVIGFLVCLVVVLWYTPTFPDINVFLDSNKNLKYLGAVLIVVLIVLEACFIGCRIYIHVKERNKLEHSVSSRSCNRRYQAIC